MYTLGDPFEVAEEPTSRTAVTPEKESLIKEAKPRKQI